jgi:alpha-mannosidase
LLKVEPADVLVTALKPADHGNGLIVRLFNASTDSKIASLRWDERRPKAVYLSDTTEKPGQPLTGPLTLPSHGLVTLRAEMD